MRRNLDIKFALTSVVFFVGLVIYNIIAYGITDF